MSRDHTKLKVFHVTDELVLEVYRLSSEFPASERFGLTSQLRRAAVSVPTNIVEGCARRSGNEYLQFLNQALASANEARYLLTLGRRLSFAEPSECTRLEDKYGEICKMLQAMLDSLSRAA